MISSSSATSSNIPSDTTKQQQQQQISTLPPECSLSLEEIFTEQDAKELNSFQTVKLHCRKADQADVLRAMLKEEAGFVDDDDHIHHTSLDHCNRIQDQFADHQETATSSSSSLESSTVLDIEDLDEESLEQLLSQLLKSDESNSKQSSTEEQDEIALHFLMREDSLKPPEPGLNEVKKQVEFPPRNDHDDENTVPMESVGHIVRDHKRDKLSKEKFKIVRAVPGDNTQTELRSVPFICITFSHDMIEEFDAEPLPFEAINFVEIVPVTENIKEGKWKWIGTKSLLFQPKFRFDRSSSFTYRVLQEKTKSIYGQVLESTFEVTFKTQTMQLSRFVPYGSFPISQVPFCYLEFDQDIDPQQVLNFITVQTSSLLSRGTAISFELFTDLKLIEQTLQDLEFKKKFKQVYSMYMSVLKNHSATSKRHFWIKLLIDNDTFNAGKGYPKIGLGEKILATIKEGIPSLEGPRPSTSPFTYYFYGHGKMKVTDYYPKKSIFDKIFGSNIYPGSSFSFYFSNPIDLEKFKNIEDFISVEPSIEQMRVTRNGTYISIQGDTKPREKYTVIIKKGLPDIYGQELESDYVTTFEISGQGKTVHDTLPQNSILPPSLFDNNDPFLYFDSVNIPETHVVINQIDPEEFYVESTIPKLKQQNTYSSNNYEYFNWYPKKPISIGKMVLDEKVKSVNFEKDKVASTQLSLSPYLQNTTQKTGQLLVQYKPKDTSLIFKSYTHYVLKWIQVSNLCVEIFRVTGDDKVSVFVTDFRTGKPVPNASLNFKYSPQYYGQVGIEVKFMSEEATTNENGIGYLTPVHGAMYYSRLIVKTDTDSVILIQPQIAIVSARTSYLTSHIITDRGLYKPKETLHVKGYFRTIDFNNDKSSDLFGTYSVGNPRNCNVSYVINDSLNVSYAEGKFETTENGTFSLDVQLPDNVNLGAHSIRFICNGYTFYSRFSVEEFRTPEYNVQSSVIPSSLKTNNFIGDQILFKTEANYYSGSALSSARVTSNLDAKVTSFTPEGWSNYTFQESANSSTCCYFYNLNKKDKIKLQPTAYVSSQTGSDGNCYTMAQLWDPEKQIVYPLTISCKSNVQDINRQTHGTSASVTVHACKYYVGVRCTKRVVMKADEKIDCFFIVTNIQGKPQAGIPIQVKIVKFDASSVGYETLDSVTPIREFGLVSTTEPLLYSFSLENDTQDLAYAEYGILCEVREKSIPRFRSGVNRTSVPIRKFGFKSHLQTKGYAALNSSTLDMVSDKFDNDHYLPGEEAKIYVANPFSGDSLGFMFVTCNGLVKKEYFEIKANVGYAQLTVPIRKEYRPNIEVIVNLYGQDQYIDENDKNRSCPTYATGRLTLNVSKEHHELDVAIIPKHSVVGPGAETSVEVIVTDKQGTNQSNCEVCLIVADEAVLDMANHEISNPLTALLPSNSCTAEFRNNRELVRYWYYPPKNQRELELQQQFEASQRQQQAFDGRGGGAFSRGCSLEDMTGELDAVLCQSDSCSKCKSCSFFGGLSLASVLPSCKCSRRCEEYEATCGGCSCHKNCRLRECKNMRVNMNHEMAASLMQGRQNEFNVRTDFRPDAHFVGFAQTDHEGKVKIDFKLPDSLTRFRVTALASASSDRFGVNSSKITTCLPLSCRPSLPRFLNYGDACDLTYVLQNQTSATLTVALVCHTTNLRLIHKNQLQRKRGITVVLKGLERKEVRLPVQVQKCGKARINVGIRVIRAVPACSSSDAQESVVNDMVGWSDAVKNDINVFTPATTEAFATYGDIQDKSAVIAQPIALPKKRIISHFGEVSFSTSTTALSTLTDSLIYLYTYPFECTEQIASKVIGIVCMKDIILQFYTPEQLKKLMDISSAEEIDSFVKDELKRIFDRQKSDGSFSVWKTILIGDPFLTCHVALCFAKCRQYGYEIPSTVLESSKRILLRIESLFFLGFLWPQVLKDTIKSFAYYVYSLLMESDEEKKQVRDRCEKLLSHYKDVNDLTGKMSPDCAAWLSVALHRSTIETSEENQERSGFLSFLFEKGLSASEWLQHLKSYFKENVTVDSGVYAEFISSYRDDETAKMVMLHSDVRTNANVMSALMEIDREESSDLIQKLLRSVLAERNNHPYGRWRNTIDNASCMISVTDYFREFEKDIPDMTVNTWLVDTTKQDETLYLGPQTWKGRSKDKMTTLLPVKALIPRQYMDEQVIDPQQHLNCNKELVVSKVGDGRLYYRIALSYTPENLTLPALDRGFSIHRTYEGVTHKEHVTFDKIGNSWKIKSGELVRVTLTFTNTARRYNIALMDKLPAGLEPVNPELESQHLDLKDINLTSNDSTTDMTKYWSRWFEHQNIRTERVEAFARILYEGSHTYSYIARATSIGSFVAPPSHVEEMYCPECFGRSKTEFVQIFNE
ncbi:hypothetical protein C9374_010671 [Naegleria lovaniensis]|uniref:Alpha-2-macroglobulin domain-containing protein n=1 Tax=Naegleria lovaniensis TaxID=51637 RepID=A0AA88GFH3_NAELO|nr:uncharacterized protein C9374_010671 [Naegleria lovaniensis]KAG2374652.1 hypothetical protein C9374_010671 [Naegleria lovaniensis]